MLSLFNEKSLDSYWERTSSFSSRKEKVKQNLESKVLRFKKKIVGRNSKEQKTEKKTPVDLGKT